MYCHVVHWGASRAAVTNLFEVTSTVCPQQSAFTQLTRFFPFYTTRWLPALLGCFWLRQKRSGCWLVATLCFCRTVGGGWSAALGTTTGKTCWTGSVVLLPGCLRNSAPSRVIRQRTALANLRRTGGHDVSRAPGRVSTRCVHSQKARPPVRTKLHTLRRVDDVIRLANSHRS